MRKIFPGADVEIPAGDETLIVSRADPTDVSSHFNEHSLAAAQMPCRDSNRLEARGPADFSMPFARREEDIPLALHRTGFRGQRFDKHKQ